MIILAIAIPLLAFDAPKPKPVPAPRDWSVCIEIPDQTVCRSGYTRHDAEVSAETVQSLSTAPALKVSAQPTTKPTTGHQLYHPKGGK